MERVRRRLKGFDVQQLEATREARKGRAKGGVLLAIRRGKNMNMIGEMKKENKEVIWGKVKVGGKEWLVGTTYMREARRENWEKISEVAEGHPGTAVVFGGDYNARIGREGGRWLGGRGEEEEEERGRGSKDGMINAEGREIIENMREAGLHVLNGNVEGEEIGEFTFVGAQGRSTIDYVVVNEEGREEMESMRIEKRTESDHLPLVVVMKCGEEEEEEEVLGEMEDWSEEGMKVYLEKLGEKEVE